MATYSEGQSLVELIMALAFAAIILTTLVATATLSIRASVFARNQSTATRFSQQAIEWLRSEKDASWTTFKNNTTTTNYCLNNLSWTAPGNCGGVMSGTILSRSVNFVNNADGSITANVSTTWSDSQGTHTVPISTIFTNWK